MYCSHCGADLPNGTKFCTSCGTEQTAAAAAIPQPADRQPIRQSTAQPYASFYASEAPIYSNNDPSRLPPQYKPLSAWDYLGYSLLYSIPLIGLIILIVNASNNENINRRNHARSFFCGLILAVIIGVVAFVLAAVFGFNIMDELEYNI